MSSPDKNSFREEYCPSHLEVEWEISYETLQKCGDALRSPVFKIGRHSYMLESDGRILYVICRGPPSFGRDRSFTVQYWGGLKHTDGDYDLTYESHSEKFCGSYDKHIVAYIPDTDLDRLYLTQDGCLKFFFRINIKRPLVGMETCIHGTPRMPNPEAGSIRQETCSRHHHVEWNISYGIQQDSATDLTSPVFKIGTQIYFFRLLRECIREVSFHLFRLGRSVDGPAAGVRYWIGLKCRDGTYHSNYWSDKLDLSEDFGFWTLVETLRYDVSKLEEKYLTLDRRLTFFFWMNVDPTGAYLCSHGATDQIAPQATGTILEEQCSSHKQIEWEIGYTVSEDRVINLESPVFQIGTQEYFFTTSFEKDRGVGLNLMRRGRSVRGPAAAPRCWAGFKCNNGTYHYSISSHQVDLREDFGLWTYSDYLMFVWPEYVKELYLTPDSRLTFLFRMNTETTGPQMCTHVSAEMPSSITGRIREARCSTHTEVEWDVDLKVVRGDELRSLEWLISSGSSAVHRKLSLTSPVFKINYQMYFLELIGNIKNVPSLRLCLYRLGRSVEGPASSVRCWAGLKNPDNTYSSRIFSKKLDLPDDFELWTLLASLRHFDHAELIEHDLDNIRSLTFFFRMNVEPTGTDECTHGSVDMYATSGEGSIQIQECPSHKHVLWDVAYEAARKTAYCASPVFNIGNQCYQLNVCYDFEVHKEVTLELYRSGCSVEDPSSSIQCWAGLKRCDGSYHHHIQKVEVDLSEEFLLLTNVSSFNFPCRSDLESTHVTSDGRLTFFLQLNVPQATGDEASCAHGAVEMCPPGKGCIRERNNNLVEWDVVYEEPREYTHFSTSPVFKMGTQCYLLELCHGIDGILALSLYRFGRSVKGSAGSVRCWAGLKRDRGMYHHNIEGFEFDLRRDCELWTKVKILGYFRRYDLENEGLMRDGRLTFFFLICAEDRQSKDVAVQTNGNQRGAGDDKTHQNSEGLQNLRQDDRLWLQHPEEGGKHPSSSHGEIRG